MNYARNTNLKEKKKEKEKKETPNFTIGVLTFFFFDVSLVPLANKSLFIKHMPPFLTLEVLPLLPSESGGKGRTQWQLWIVSNSAQCSFLQMKCDKPLISV